ncbi:MAG: hypothetical protein D6692_09215 [Planctomycetota bacterium]|nr:MAG: hypothetical protein D6692_09215 [Planctomycetota bacterium]
MNRRTTLLCLAGLAAVSTMTGCRVERTEGQRHQARAIDTVLRAEAARLNESPLSEQTLEDYARLNHLYQELLHAAIRSGEAEPLTVQEAEDKLRVIASEARLLPAYQSWSPEAQKNFEEQFWRFRLQKWQMWRGPGFIYE